MTLSTEFTWEGATRPYNNPSFEPRPEPVPVPIENDAADLQFAHLVYLCAVLARVQLPVWDIPWR